MSPDDFNWTNPDDYNDPGCYFAALEDRVRKQREERARVQVKALSLSRPREHRPLQETVPTIPASVSGFRLDVKPKRHQSARSKSIDGLLESFGVGVR